jgi:hypothetical protein
MSAEHLLNVVERASQQPQDAPGVFAPIDRRAIIEQTTGMLMLAYAVNAETAFDLLRRPARRHDLDLYDLARQVRDDLLEVSGTDVPVDPLTLDCLLYTAHARIATGERR